MLYCVCFLFAHVFLCIEINLMFVVVPNLVHVCLCVEIKLMFVVVLNLVQCEAGACPVLFFVFCFFLA